ncbi:MAG: molybdopterin adenylyltransferase [Planctomycetota bacterium]
MTSTRIALLTVSDRASTGEYEDRSGPALDSWISQHVRSEYEILSGLVPDEIAAIEAQLRAWIDEKVDLVIATGGTGPSPRDVTPDAVELVCERIYPGFGERMRGVAVDRLPTAMLSRQLAGSSGKTLIIALPGSPKAIAECLDAVFPAIPHCIELLGGVPPRYEKAVNPNHE